MTNQEKKSYLLRYRSADNEITDLLNRRDEIKSRLERMTPTYSGMPGGSGESDKMTNGVAKLIELEREIDSKTDKLVDFRREVENHIDKIRIDNFRRVLKLRYIDGLKWDSIADVMHYDIDAKKVFVLHGHALTALELDTERH